MAYAGAMVLSRWRFGDIALQQGEQDNARAEYAGAVEAAQKLGQTLPVYLANQRLAQAGVSIE